ncbi:MAG: DUF362 domain-containing protein [Phycisphaerae bacterium]|nr:DUF362 domain-containing protein [Phycisphaerae bacterium]
MYEGENSDQMISDPHVAIFRGEARYPHAPPFHPGEAFPEYPFGDAIDASEANHTYLAVRGSLQLLGLDAAAFGTSRWNPLGRIIHPGHTVVLKPNFVRDFREADPDHGDCLITHGSIIRAVLDYVYIATAGRGRVIIADAPQNDADFQAIRRIAGLEEIQGFYRRHAGFEVEVYDLRPERAKKVDGVITGHERLAGDPAGYVKVNLGTKSMFVEVNHLCHLLYGAEYDMGELRCHHHDDVHEYLVSRTILDADVVISLPKLKTHKKVGVTLNLKNLVGINGNKNWLPHHREGTPARGGDQFPDDRLKNRIERVTVDRFKRLFPLLGPVRPAVAALIKPVGKRIFGDTNVDTVRSGNWHGNDTTWRMVIDLNRILHHADTGGVLRDRPVRGFFSVVDGIVAGEGNGPLDPTAKAVGVVLAGMNPVAVDVVCARLMGFDYRRLPMLYRSFEDHPLPVVSFSPDEITARSNDPDFDGFVHELRSRGFGFKPHFGWKGHVELARPAASDSEGLRAPDATEGTESA